MNSLRIRRLHEAAPLPVRQHPDDAGLDLLADMTTVIDAGTTPPTTAEVPMTIHPGEHAMVPTGIAMALPEGTVGMVCPRSGLAAKKGVTVLNGPGQVDAGYRGEVKVVLINHGAQPIRIEHGMRIAQLVITPILTPAVEVVDELDDTTRGAGGFGSTGV